MKALTPVPLALLLLGSGLAAAQGFPASGTPQLAQQVQPSSPQPQDLPPPPPEDLPPVPQEQAAVPPPQPAATGQWVFTAQYGWIWMPYGAEYVSPPTSYAYAPYAYVYYPPSGWMWLAAPWIDGWGRWAPAPIRRSPGTRSWCTTFAGKRPRNRRTSRPRTSSTWWCLRRSSTVRRQTRS